MDLYGHHALHSKKCIHIHLNGTFLNGKVLYVQMEWDMDQLLSAVSQRLEMIPQATRIYNSDGIEIEDTIMIEDQSHIFVSTGADFLSPFVKTTNTQEEKLGETDYEGSFEATSANEKSYHSTEEESSRDHKSSIYSISPSSYKSRGISESKLDDREEKSGWEDQYEMKSNEENDLDGSGNEYYRTQNEGKAPDSYLHDSEKVSNYPISPISQSGTKGIPPIVGGYIVGEMLGKGGFGEVRLGCHQLTQEKVAIKFLNKSTAIANMGAAERATTEIQCLMALNHQNIIRLLQQFDTSKYLVMVFELMEGGDLQHHLSEKAFFSEDEARPIFHQIVSAVSYAHNHHICHRDLKLENILICKSTLTSHSNQNLGNNNQIKIADFGLSDFYPPGATRKSQCGSFAYLAPEIFKGTSNAGPPIDVWALGVILFTMLCGRLPFEAEQTNIPNGPGSKRERSSQADELNQIRSKIVKCQYKINENLSPEVKDLIRRILKLNVMERATIPEIITHVWFRSKDNNCLNGNVNGINSNIHDLPIFEGKVEDDLKYRRAFASTRDSSKVNVNSGKGSYYPNEVGTEMGVTSNSRYTKHQDKTSKPIAINKKSNTSNTSNVQQNSSNVHMGTSPKQIEGQEISHINTEGNNPSIMFDVPLMVTSPNSLRFQSSRNRNSNSISPKNANSIFGNNDLFESQSNTSGGNSYSSFPSVHRNQNGLAFDFDRDHTISSSSTTEKRGHIKQRSTKSSSTYKNSISPKLTSGDGNNNKGRNYWLDENIDQDTLESKKMENQESLGISGRLPPVSGIILQSPSSKKVGVSRNTVNKLVPLIGNEEEPNYRGSQPSIGNG